MTTKKQISTPKKLIQLTKIGAPICVIIGFCYTFLPKIWNQLSVGIWLSILGILILCLAISVSYRLIAKKRLLRKQEKDKELSIRKLEKQKESRKEYLKHIQESNDSAPKSALQLYEDEFENP